MVSAVIYDKKTAENYRNCYVAEKRIVYISINDIDRKF